MIQQPKFKFGDIVKCISDDIKFVVQNIELHEGDFLYSGQGNKNFREHQLSLYVQPPTKKKITFYEYVYEGVQEKNLELCWREKQPNSFYRRTTTPPQVVEVEV